MWILISKSGEAFSHKPGVISMFKSQFKAAMFAYYELDCDKEWEIKEVVADAELIEDSYVNFIE